MSAVAVFHRTGPLSLVHSIGYRSLQDLRASRCPNLYSSDALAQYIAGQLGIPRLRGSAAIEATVAALEADLQAARHERQYQERQLQLTQEAVDSAAFIRHAR